MRRAGRHSAAVLLVAGLVVMGILAVRPAQASPGHMIGMDMKPSSGASVSSSGTDTCVEVDAGDSFEADVFATNLQNLTHFELRIDFDPEILSLDKDAVDFNHFLAKDGGSAQFPLVEEEKPGRWFIGAIDNQSPDSGSGTLARLRFTALDEGTSSISITGRPAAFAPRLGSFASYLGDDDGDGYWDSALSSGKVAVEGSCAGSTPIVTPAPTNLPATTPRPDTGSGTPAATEDGDDPGDGGDSNGSDGSGDDGGPEDTSEPQVGNVGSGGDGSSPTRAPGNVQGSEDEGDGANPAASDGGSSSSTVLIVLAIAGALLAVSGTGLVLWLRNNSQPRY